MSMLVTKIGADTVDFRGEVGKLPGVVKNNFDKMKQASEGGIVENVKGIKKGFGDLKDVLVGGGIVTAVVGFYRAAQEEAKKAAANGSALAQGAVDLGDKFASLKQTVVGAGMGFFGIVNTAIDALRDGYVNIAAAVTGNLGDLEKTRDIVDQSAKGAREQERALAEMKKHASDFNKLNADAKKLSEDRAAAELKTLTLSDQRAVLQQKLLAAQRAEEESGGNALARRTAQVEQLKIGNQLMEVSKAIDAEAAKEREQIAKIREDERKTILATLTAEERSVVIANEVVALEALLQSASLSQETSARTRVTLAERRKELLENENKLAEERAKIDEKNIAALEDSARKEKEVAIDGLSLQEQKKRLTAEIARLDQEIAEGLIFGLDISEQQKRYDEARAKLREIEKKETSDQVEIAKLLLKGAENLTAEDKLRLDLLRGVVTQKKLDQEITELTAKAVAGMLTPAEKERLAVLVGQREEIAKQLTDIKGVTAEVMKLRRTGREAEDQSTIALEGALNRAKSQLQALERDTSYQSVFSPNGKNPLYYTLQMEVQRMENELDARKRVSGYAATYGEDATRYKFGDTLTDKALRDIQTTGEKQQKDIERLTIAVTRSALFRKTAPGN